MAAYKKLEHVSPALCGSAKSGVLEDDWRVFSPSSTAGYGAWDDIDEAIEAINTLYTHKNGNTYVPFGLIFAVYQWPEDEEVSTQSDEELAEAEDATVEPSETDTEEGTEEDAGDAEDGEEEPEPEPEDEERPKPIGIKEYRVTSTSGSIESEDDYEELTYGSNYTAGDNISISEEGVISAQNSFSLPTASTSTKGGIKIGSDFDIDADGKLSLYKAMAITSFSASPSQAEIGSTVNSVTLSWSINKIAATLTLDGVAVTATSKVDNTSRTTNKTWTLKAVDARGTEVTKTASLTFYHRYYVGASAKATLDNSDVLAFASQAFATSRAKAATEYDCSGGKYPYFCFPESWGTPSFVVGGLPNSDFVKQTISLTNASGNTTTYSVWRTSGIQTGKLTIQVK